MHTLSPLSVEQRFGSVLASHEAKMATTTLPKFRLSWLSPEKRDDIRRNLLQEAIALEPLHSLATVSDDNSVKSDESEDNFFSLIMPNHHLTAQVMMKSEST